MRTQTRRTTRLTRTATARDNENANARPSRSRAKPPSTAAAAPSSKDTARATAPTAASRARNATADTNHVKVAEAPIGKRKRAALGELTTIVSNNKPKGAKRVSKDGKVFDGVVLKTRARQPLQQVDAPQKKNAQEPDDIEIIEDTDDNADVHHGNGMVVDKQQPKRALPSLTVRRSLARETTNGRSRTSHHHVRNSSTTHHRQADDDAEADRVFKKRRTSSEAPEDVQALHEAQIAADEAAVEAALEAEMQEYADSEPEADPETSRWDDLDAQDDDDPAMVSEYVVEIFQYMRELEARTMPNPNYMENQKELAWKMRGILTDWLIQIHVRFRMLPETLFLCVNLVDRFLSCRVVSLAKLQLVGVTCMFIAAKVEEVIAPAVQHFLMCADSNYTESEMLQAEKYVLKSLDWNLSFPNPVHFLRRVSKADDYDIRARTLGKYLIEIGTVEWRLLSAPPSLMAAAGIWLARLALGKCDWTPNLAHYSGYAESSILSTAATMVNFLLRPIRHESFHKKYAGKKFCKASIFMRSWALARWPENGHVDLARDLPALKAEARAMCQQEEIEIAREMARNGRVNGRSRRKVADNLEIVEEVEVEVREVAAPIPSRTKLVHSRRRF
ncbi:hypothetical protein FISHEDRAFT_65729 [Fistulina hepatica ATCC 64428]|uniref:Uncharacterized protein n=1 Tax=Fistulina hepatica ATCC 64428 TaxID=1128425 RepID=A0A0D7ADF7_9AGAR|nr:hypothetical protein FISHEDRAFT_65729 [Fistulina hepatica ATCC 64428]